MMRQITVVLIGVAILFFTINQNFAAACLAPDNKDYGDAPDSFDSGYYFPTLDASGGAYHLESDLYLGAGITWEMDGQPGLGAASDVGDDGVLFTSPLLAGKTAYITVNTSGYGFLSAWLDFNLDGDWEDAGEQIFYNDPVAVGDNSLSFEVPLDVSFGWTYARFRLSSDSLDSFSGGALDGEVEDYMVEVSHAPVPNAMILLGVGMIGLAGIGRKKLQ